MTRRNLTAQLTEARQQAAEWERRYWAAMDRIDTLLDKLAERATPKPAVVLPPPVDAETRAVRAATDTFLTQAAADFRRQGMSESDAKRAAAALREELGPWTQPEG